MVANHPLFLRRLSAQPPELPCTLWRPASWSLLGAWRHAVRVSRLYVSCDRIVFRSSKFCSDRNTDRGRTVCRLQSRQAMKTQRVCLLIESIASGGGKSEDGSRRPAMPSDRLLASSEIRLLATCGHEYVYAVGVRFDRRVIA